MSWSQSRQQRPPWWFFFSFPRGSESRLRPHQALSHAHTRLYRCNFKGALAEGGPTPAVSRREGWGQKNLSHMWLPHPSHPETFIFSPPSILARIWYQKSLTFAPWVEVSGSNREVATWHERHIRMLGKQCPEKALHLHFKMCWVIGWTFCKMLLYCFEGRHIMSCIAKHLTLWVLCSPLYADYFLKGSLYVFFFLS